MNNINKFLSIVSVALCCLYGCSKAESSYCADCNNNGEAENNESAASCSDGILNGDETGVDCGGLCSACPDNMPCLMNSDCISDNCENSVCKPQNIICAGGSCGSSPNTDKSADGATCNSNEDCQSNKCDGVCISCTDGNRNGDESDIDCGGSCGKCAIGQRCNSEDDCNNFCDANICTNCSDGIQNGDEAGIDCGGRCGSNCALESACNTDKDCESYNCAANTCKTIECPDSAHAGDIIINEVFANPDTEKQMVHSNNQQMKYIELYNKSNKTLQLYNLALSYNGNEIHAKGCIPARSYLIIHPSNQNLTALDIDAKTLASDNIETAINTTSGNVSIVKRTDNTVIHSASVPATEKGTSAGRDLTEDNSTNDETLVPHSSVQTTESGVENLYSPGLPNNTGFPMG